MFLIPTITSHNTGMARNLDTALLRTFAAVAGSTSMTAAAAALHLTQGAVSQQVRRLEDSLGCTLFERGRSLKLTPAGERLLGKARQMLQLNDDIWAEMAPGAVSGQVRLGVPYDLVGTVLAPVLKAFTIACPQVEISLICAASPELVDALDAGTLDLAVVEEPVDTARGECLAVQPLVWVGARAGTAHRKMPLPVSMVADTCAFRPAVLAALQDHGRAWRTVFENGSIDATTATVATDLAITAWLACTVPLGLEILGPETGLPPLPRFAITLHLPRRGAGTAAQELARHLREGLLRPPLAA